MVDDEEEDEDDRVVDECTRWYTVPLITVVLLAFVPFPPPPQSEPLAWLQLNEKSAPELLLHAVAGSHRLMLTVMIDEDEEVLEEDEDDDEEDVRISLKLIAGRSRSCTQDAARGLQTPPPPPLLASS